VINCGLVTLSTHWCIIHIHVMVILIIDFWCVLYIILAQAGQIIFLAISVYYTHQVMVNKECMLLLLWLFIFTLCTCFFIGFFLI